MKRSLYKELLKWKLNIHKKPLLLQGARQVGKTYLVSQFAENEYKNTYHFNFEKDKQLREFFTGTLKPEDIIQKLSLFIGKKIIPEDSLIFFDEIQVEPNILLSLKYFCEDAPEYNIIAAGSLLGVSIGKTVSFPVGKINFLTLYPFSFIEFLNGIGESLLAEHLEKNVELKPFDIPIHEKLLSLFADYLYIGGMPEAVQSYVDDGTVFRARKIQIEILKAYERDFSKYSTPAQAIKTLSVWNSIPLQLAKENKKFQFGIIKKGARFATYESSLEWLKNAGLINVANNIKVPKLPLSAYAEQHKLKLYLLDTGLLGAMLEIEPATILNSRLFSEFKGIFIENYIAIELKSNEFTKLFYWTSKSEAEVDFILKINETILPVEVKSGMDRRKKSLQVYDSKYNPANIIRFSPRNFEVNGKFINLPLYAVSLLQNGISYIRSQKDKQN